MTIAEPQHSRAQTQPAARQGGGAAFDSPQGEQTAQLEAMMESSPQAEKHAQIGAMIDASPAMAAQRRVVDMIHNSPRQAAQAKLFESIHNSPRQMAQKKAFDAIHNSPRQMAQRKKLENLFGTAQRQEAEEPLQPKSETAQLAEAAPKPNNTGLPDNLKSGIESLSGLSMDSVRVHYNSSQPAQLNAHAYAQGTDIHVAPGQEKHLPHEAWHVVQQAQGRVQPTMQMKDSVPVNDDKGLEHEADAMGAKAAQRMEKQAMPVPLPPSSPSSPAQLQGIAQLEETTPTVSDGADLDIMGNLASISWSFATSFLWKALWNKEVLRNALTRVTNYVLTSIAGLGKWLDAIKDAYAVLKTVANIPRGVVAVVSWIIGKTFLRFADTVYNGSWLSRRLGEITEEKIFTVLHVTDEGHHHIQLFVEFLDGLVQKIGWLLTSGQDQDKAPGSAPKDSAPKPEPSTKGDAAKFLSVKVAPPALGSWSDEGKKRAGLEVQASAHLTLLGQTMGGDFDAKLPFGPHWKIGISNFFKSSSFSLPGLKVDHISGDSLVFTDTGLERAQMSVNGLDVASGIVQADILAVDYQKGKDSITFTGEGSAQLWDDKRLEGTLLLVLGTDGAFREAGIKLKTGATFSPIPGYLDIKEPGGSVEIFDKKPPNVLIYTGILLKGLPNGITAEAKKGGIKYENGALSGFLNGLDVTIPLVKGATLVIAIIDAEFTKDGVTARNARIDIDYDKSRAAKEQDGGVAASGIFASGLDLSWLDVSGIVNLEQLSVRAGLANLSFSGGKFDYKRDDSTGLRKLNATVLGVTAKYDAEEKAGSLKGEISKSVEATLVRVDIPIVPGAGGSLEITGGFEVGAGLDASLKQEAQPTPQVTVLVISGQLSAHAAASLALKIGAFVGVPYLATMRGSVFGAITGTLEGKAGLSGGVQYDEKKGRLENVPDKPAKGEFDLKAELSAQVGAELKAQVLIFEKELVKVEFGDWTLGEYGVSGSVTSGEAEPVFKIDRQGFTGGGPKPMAPRKTPIKVDEMISEKKKQGKITYGPEAASTVQKVARDILRGGFDTRTVATLKVDYLVLLSDPEHKTMFSEAFNRLQDQIGNIEKASYVWSKEEWAQAVELRTILGFQQSKSKQQVFDLLGEYHAMKPEDHEGRLQKLSAITEVLVNYADNRSKVPANKEQADRLRIQIGLEEARIRDTG